MKNLMIFGIFIICLVAAQFTFAQTADEVVDKYVTALGGKEKMLALKTVKMVGSLSVQGADVSLTIQRKHMVGARADISVMGTENFQLTTPEKSWSFMPIQRQEAPEEVAPETHKSLLGQLDVQGTLVNYKEKGHTIEYKGKENVDNNECYKLIVNTKYGKASTYFIDTKTNRIVKVAGKVNRGGEEVDSETIFSDYKQNKDGYWFAYTQVGAQGETIFSSIETNVAIDDSIFKVN